eukprot:2373179-Rhodomonas_salina.4
MQHIQPLPTPIPTVIGDKVQVRKGTVCVVDERTRCSTPASACDQGTCGQRRTHPIAECQLGMCAWLNFGGQDGEWARGQGHQTSNRGGDQTAPDFGVVSGVEAALLRDGTRSARATRDGTLSIRMLRDLRDNRSEWFVIWAHGQRHDARDQDGVHQRSGCVACREIHTGMHQARRDSPFSEAHTLGSKLFSQTRDAKIKNTTGP